MLFWAALLHLLAAEFRRDSRTALVPVTVTDSKGALVQGLSAKAFTVTQDNVPQLIASFGQEDIPASIGIVLDTSGSMKPVLSEAKSMLSAFFGQCNPRDEAFVYSVSTKPGIGAGYTSDFGTLLSQPKDPARPWW